MNIKIYLKQYRANLLQAGLAFAICALLGSGFFVYKKVSNIRAISNRSAEARETVSKIRSIKALITDTESAQLGYILTGNKDYLDPYLETSQEVPRQLDSFRESIADQPDQIRRFLSLKENVEAKLKELSMTIDLKNNKGTAAAVAVVNTNSGLRWMNEIRRITKEMDDDQQRQVAERNREMNDIINSSTYAVQLSSSFALLLTITCFALLIRHNRDRTKAEQSLREANKILESHQQVLSKIISIQEKVAAAGNSTSDIMRLTVQHSMGLTGADGAAIELVDGDELVYSYTNGTAMRLLGARTRQKDSFSSQSLQLGQVLVCNDSEMDPRLNLENCRKVNSRSIIAVPLKRGNTVIGVLKNYSANSFQFKEEQQKALFLINGFMSSAFGQAFEFEEKIKLVETLQKTKEDLTQSKDRAEMATKEKSQFFAIMSHEFRTPLNGILGMTNLLLDENLTPNQIDYAVAIKNSGDALLRIINDALDFSKFEAGKIDLENVDFHLISTLEDLKKSFNFIARQKDISLTISIAPEVPAFVCGDPGRIRQILTNLVGNALKFTPTGFVNVSVDVISSDPTNIYLRFEIRDSGVGIPKGALENIFQEFSKASISTYRHYGGTGLGLSISKSLVEKMSGQIGVASEIGKGSTFWFTIRLQPGRKVEVLPDDHAVIRVDHEYLSRVLIVEDNPVNQTIITKMLEKLQIRCDVAANGKEAIEAMQNRPYDLILMDCNMPEMDGYEATHFIRTSALIKNSQIPIVAMTANAIEDEAQRCFSAGMDDYLPKPLNIKRVGEMMNKWSLTLKDRRKNLS